MAERFVERMMERLYVLPSGDDDGITDIYLYWHYKGKSAEGWVLQVAMYPRHEGRRISFDVVPVEFSYSTMRNHAPYPKRSASLSVNQKNGGVDVYDSPPFDPLNALDKHLMAKMMVRLMELYRSGGLRGHDQSSAVHARAHAMQPNPRRGR